jgi:hypothetical protein
MEEPEGRAVDPNVTAGDFNGQAVKPKVHERDLLELLNALRKTTPTLTCHLD